MREAENIREVEQLSIVIATPHSQRENCPLSINWMGFIFWPKSSRYVSERPAYLPTKCKRVRVFVDEDIETVKRIAEDYDLDFIQLHGHESADYCAQLQDLKLIKAISVSGQDDIATYRTYEGLVDYFLFDTKCFSVGGSGQQFDWSVLSAYDDDTPFLLSGGIGPDDAERVKAFHHPKCVGIDLNSRFEQAPGLKDINKLKDFLNALNNEQD